MFKKLGFGSGKSKKRPKKKRLSPSAHERIVGEDGSSLGTTPPPSYQYAMNEYALTGPSAAIARRSTTALANMDDEGYIRPSFSMTDVDEEQETELDDLDDSANAIMQDERIATTNVRLHEQEQNQNQHQQHRENDNVSPTPPTTTENKTQNQTNNIGQQQSQSKDGILRSSSYKSQSDPYARQRYLSPRADYLSYDEEDTVTSKTVGGINNDYYDYEEPSMLRRSGGSGSGRSVPRSGNFEPMMPDATYEEWYGDAYIGGPIRYIYPSGYQSMRPRGGPWRLSIVICLLFTWLSVFIIGHCSDIYALNHENSNNNIYNYENGYEDENDHVINEKWCGSRLLYWMWVISMLIMGVACAYCGVIGYIKVRDFAVANARSQPPGIMTVGDYPLSAYGDSQAGGSSSSSKNKGNSDYYVPISDADLGSQRRHNPQQQNVSTTNYRAQQTHPAQYRKTIYQADGTPQFWGNQIYRPNQAAVHTVSR